MVINEKSNRLQVVVDQKLYNDLIKRKEKVGQSDSTMSQYLKQIIRKHLYGTEVSL